MDAIEFAAATEGLIEQRDVSVRQVSGGFLIVGTRRFLDPDTQAIKLAQNIEAISPNAATAGADAGDFLINGKF